MRRFFKITGALVTVLVVLVAAVWLLGPREPIDTTVRFDVAALGDDLDGYLASREARFDDIKNGTQKRIVWAGEKGRQTEFAFVYVHGFSASSEEIRPVPDEVAKRFGSNLYFTRLAGHGRSDLALSEPSMNDWVQDFAEAMAIGKRIGKRVVLITTSTGGSLAITGAALPEFKEDIAGMVLISPNFGPVNPLAQLANWPLARNWVPLLVGEWREWEPLNAQQGLYWTTRSQNIATLPMMALVKQVNTVDLSSIHTPALFMYSEQDKVVSAPLTAAAIAKWGGPKQVEIRVMTPQDTPSHHVIAGDIMSPNQTAETVRIIGDWVAGL